MRQRVKIMRKFLVCMVTLLAMSMASVYADNQSAMLQQGDSITLFYGKNALTDAYTAAADSGAVITLSKGVFGNLTIEKPISIIGYYGFSSSQQKGSVISQLTVKANNVSIDGLYIKELGLDAIHNCRVTHSWVNDFLDNPQWNTYTVFDQCVIGNCRFALQRSTDMVIKNSTIYTNCFANGKNSNMAYILNCVIYVPDRANEVDSYYYCIEPLPYAIYKNNVIHFDGHTGSTTLSQNDYSRFFNNTWTVVKGHISLGETCIVEENIVGAASDILPEATYPAYPTNPGVGSDGTPRGPLGGSGFTDHPSIPRITSREIGVNPDAEGKLNVKITVSAE